MPKPIPQARPREPNSDESLVGRAHHALRAYVKAYSVRAADKQGSYSFLIAANRQSATILDPAGQEVLCKSIAELAAEGARVRLALAGLRDIKERLELPLTNRSSLTIRYRLDVLDGVAELTINGVPLTKEELVTLIGNSYRTVLGADPVLEAVSGLTGGPLTEIASWAAVGRPISSLLFSALASAEEYGFTEAATEARERAYRLGLIHRRLGQD